MDMIFLLFNIDQFPHTGWKVECKTNKWEKPNLWSTKITMIYRLFNWTYCVCITTIIYYYLNNAWECERILQIVTIIYFTFLLRLTTFMLFFTSKWNLEIFSIFFFPFSKSINYRADVYLFCLLFVSNKLCPMVELM